MSKQFKTVKGALNYMVRAWGMECVDTREGFIMAQNGASVDDLATYIAITEAVWEADWFGFETLVWED